MSHENPYISRDVDIGAYVLQKDTAMNPYIVHMKTDILSKLKKIVPKSLRSQDFQKGMDVKNSKKINDNFRGKIDKLMSDMKSISEEGVKKTKELDDQLQRLAKETVQNTEKETELNETIAKIKAFRAEVDRLEKATNQRENM